MSEHCSLSAAIVVGVFLDLAKVVANMVNSGRSGQSWGRIGQNGRIWGQKWPIAAMVANDCQSHTKNINI
jgi:hypothetical protein